MKLALGMALLAALGFSGPARSAVITENFTIDAANFVYQFGDASVPPVDPVHIAFSITFDNSADIARSTSGLSITSLNLPFSTEYSYWKLGDNLAIGTRTGVGYGSFDDYCFFISGVSTGPYVIFFGEENSLYGFYKASKITMSVTGAPGTPLPTPAPEPETWALMILGMGAVGSALRLSRQRAGGPHFRNGTLSPSRAGRGC